MLTKQDGCFIGNTKQIYKKTVTKSYCHLPLNLPTCSLEAGYMESSFSCPYPLPKWLLEVQENFSLYWERCCSTAGGSLLQFMNSRTKLRTSSLTEKILRNKNSPKILFKSICGLQNKRPKSIICDTQG